MDTNTSINPRVQQTKRQLRRALLELLRNKPLDRITVTELCKKAGLNRNTFYSHYSSPEDLLLEIENYYAEKIIVSVQSSLKSSDFRPFVIDLCRAIQQDPDLSVILLQKDDPQSFVERIVSVVHQYALQTWKTFQPGPHPGNTEVMLEFCTGGALRLLCQWINSGMKETPEEFADKLLYACNMILNNMFTLDTPEENDKPEGKAG